jgi:xylan 1,4-beta-xylosidase
MTIHGIPKPSYRAFELLHQLGERIHSVQGSHPTVDVFVTSSTSGARILFVNSQLPRHPVETETVRLKVDGMRPARATVQRIDSAHANAKPVWKKMEEPCDLKPRDVEALKAASRLVRENLSLAKADDDRCEFELMLEPQSVALVSLES